MKKNIVIDIETLPCDDEKQIAWLQNNVTADSRIKDPVKIAADIAEKRQEIVGKTGLDGSFGRILMVTISDADSDNVATIVNVAGEDDLLNSLVKSIEAIVNDGSPTPFRPTLIGHNLAWDLRFIAQRCVVNGVKFDRRIIPFDSKPWSDEMIDTMTVWAGHGNRISLDKLCVALGVDSPKGEMDGSKVAEYYAAGKIDEIIKYNQADVEATKQCYLKMKAAGMI